MATTNETDTMIAININFSSRNAQSKANNVKCIFKIYVINICSLFSIVVSLTSAFVILFRFLIHKIQFQNLYAIKSFNKNNFISINKIALFVYNVQHDLVLILKMQPPQNLAKCHAIPERVQKITK